jgi:hypothetical protein
MRVPLYFHLNYSIEMCLSCPSSTVLIIDVKLLNDPRLLVQDIDQCSRLESSGPDVANPIVLSTNKSKFHGTFLIESRKRFFFPSVPTLI